MAPALPQSADYRLGADDRIRPSIECGGPDMAPALPQSADTRLGASHPAAIRLGAVHRWC